MLSYVTTLKTYYSNLKWYEKWFFPGNLAALLEKATSPDATISNSVSTLDIIKAAYSGTWFFHQWFYSGLSTFFSAPAADPCRWLFDRELLTEAVVEHDHSAVVAQLFREIREAVVADNQDALTNKIADLQQLGRNQDVGLLLQSCASTAFILNSCGLLLTAGKGLVNLDAILTHQKSVPLTSALELLNTFGLLEDPNAQSNLDALLALRPDCLAHLHSALTILNEEGLMTPDCVQAHFRAVVDNQSPGGVAEAFRHLKRGKIMTRDNLLAVVGHLSPASVALCLLQMDPKGLLEGGRGVENRAALLLQNDMQNIAIVLEKMSTLAMSSAGFQSAFNALMSHTNILCGADQLNPWKTLHLTLTRWVEMLMICLECRANPELGVFTWLEYAKTIHRRQRTSSQDFNSPALSTSSFLNSMEAAVRDQDPELLASVIVLLTEVGLLQNPDTSNENLRAVLEGRDARGTVARKNLKDVFHVLEIAKTVQLLLGEHAQTNFNWVMQRKDLNNVLAILRLMNGVGLLTNTKAQDNFSWVVQNKNLTGISPILDLMRRKQLFHPDHAQANFEKIIHHEALDTLGVALQVIESVYLATPPIAQANFDGLLSQNQLEECVDAMQQMEQLKLQGFFSQNEMQATYDVVVGHESPQQALLALQLLKSEGLLNNARDAQENRDALLINPALDSRLIAKALVKLYKAEILSPANRAAIVAHKFPEQVADALIDLRTKLLLEPNEDAQKNRDALISSHKPKEMAAALIELYAQQLLLPNRGDVVDANRRVLLEHADPMAVAAALIRLDKEELLPMGEKGDLLRGILVADDMQNTVVDTLVQMNADEADGVLDVLLALYQAKLIHDDALLDEFQWTTNNSAVLLEQEVFQFLTTKPLTKEQWDQITGFISEQDAVVAKNACVTYVRDQRAQEHQEALRLPSRWLHRSGTFSGQRLDEGRSQPVGLSIDDESEDVIREAPEVI